MCTLTPDGKPIFPCYKCGDHGTGYKLMQIDGFKDILNYHAVRLCPKCVDYLKEHDFPMKEVV